MIDKAKLPKLWLNDDSESALGTAGCYGVSPTEAPDVEMRERFERYASATILDLSWDAGDYEELLTRCAYRAWQAAVLSETSRIREELGPAAG